jgi:carbon-monoxide dehydrogenase iron sulfur subunit
VLKDLRRLRKGAILKEIFITVKHCLACRTCEVYCAVAHSMSMSLHGALKESPLPIPRVKIKQTRAAKAEPAQCHHCARPLCVPSCERGAISKDPETQLTIIDSTLCPGCESMPCVSACPFGAIILEKDKKVVLVCDQCVDVGEPICVQVCPTLVFSLEKAEDD